MKLNHGFARGFCVAALVLFGTVAHAAPWELRPSGGDDTARLQNALQKCTNPHRPCDLRLGAGVFHTDVLLVEGFNGDITGRGQGRTIIRAIPTLRSGERPFDDEPTLENPYPVLLHFARNSKVSISNLTVEVPAGTTVAPYTEVTWGDRIIDNALMAAIVVEGDRNARLVIKHVTIIGADDNEAPNFSTLTAGVMFRGEVRVATDNDRTRKLQHGRFAAHDNDIRRTGVGIWLADADNIDAVIVGNEIDGRTYSILTQDLGGSKISVLLNDIRGELEGILLSQNRRPADEPSDYSIGLNRIRVNEDGLSALGLAYDGVGVYDWSELPETITFNADIWANDITIGANVIAGLAVDSDGPGDIRLIGNRVRGEPPLDAGIVVAALALSRGTFIAHNDLSRNDPALVDVHLYPDSHEVRVIEPNDNVLDEGEDNDVN